MLASTTSQVNLCNNFSLTAHIRESQNALQVILLKLLKLKWCDVGQ